MWNASHWVKFITAALAAEWKGMQVSGRMAFIDDTFRRMPGLFSAIILPKNWLGNRAQ